MNTNSKNAKVGLFMLIGLLFFLGGIILISNMGKFFGKKIIATAEFKDVSGLSKGNNVWFSGVKVGRVQSLEFTPNSGVKVDFDIELKSVKYIYRDADIKITTDGLIGNPILVISGGTSKSGSIKNGHNFKVNKADSQQDMLKTLQENNKNILTITENLKTITTGINEGNGNLGKFLKDESLFNDISYSVQRLKATSGNVETFARNLNTMGNSLNNPANLPYQLINNKTIMPEIEKSVTNLSESSDILKSTSTSLKNTSNQANQFVANVQNDYSKIINDQNSVLGVLMHNKEAGSNVKNTLNNVESGSEKLDEDLEALQHSIFFRRYFKKKDKEEETDKK